MNSAKTTYFYIALLIPLIYFAVFLHLDSLPFRVWDEAYLATHTYEMMHDHDYIVTHSFGAPEMSNTKPPFAIWCMLISCKVFGFNELAVRLPNAIAAVIICFIIFLFCTVILKSSFKGFLSVLVLISSSGFIRLHVIRSGEYDALLVLFVTIYCLSYFLILENKDPHRYKMLWALFTVSLTLAILTKGVAAILIMPALFIYTMYRMKVLEILHTKEIYISTSFVLLFGLGYYLLREHYNNGYIRAVFENELGGRYLNPMIDTSPWTYLNEIVNIQFKNLLPFAFIGFFFSVSTIGTIEKRLAVYCSFIIIVLLTILSIGATRLYWYDAPIFPFLALMAGSGIYYVTFNLSKIDEQNEGRVKMLATAGLVILFTASSYVNIIASNLSTAEDPWDSDSFNLTHYIELRERAGVNLSGYKVINDWFMYRALYCQVKKWEDKGQKMYIVNNVLGLNINDKIIVNKCPEKIQIDQIYQYKVIDSYKNVIVCQILGAKI
jgi:4-amino-4-deoxy-L-arabinose transferase-like glycosyltransferase